MEEDIKILEEFKKNGYSMLYMKYGDRHTTNLKLERALENLLTRYKEQTERIIYLVNERKKLEELLYMSNENYIEKSKIKEKIEEYNKRRIKMEKDDIGIGFTLGKEWSDLKAKIEVLQELLEEE